MLHNWFSITGLLLNTKMPYKVIDQAEEFWSYKTQASQESQSHPQIQRFFAIFQRAPENQGSHPSAVEGTVNYCISCQGIVQVSNAVWALRVVNLKIFAAPISHSYLQI